ncbi:hypothetical protein CDL15_Pgr013614 [Punica granatum]|uniref:Uncharacterized protein n=1 Tax=Punica granatum TaxID=22663 RepID=A0A218W0N6_PUNGR|nr:hypothetical protein CDL15_Pgr013614 [Punica granatum]PKI70007.1 hypothetical protein CRG98_009610 [Punica granatum]
MGHNEPPEYQVFMNDLPRNDFNAILRALPRSNEKQGQCFFPRVPGSFYDRLFPSKSLHFVHSSYGLQWLSQFQDDSSLFLKHRAQEPVSGGPHGLNDLAQKK